MGKERPLESIRSSLSDEIRSAASAAGLDLVGFSRAKLYGETARHIEERKKAGLFAKLSFTTRDPSVSCDPRASLESVRSIVTCGLYYYCDPPPKPDPRAARIASYARRDLYSDLRRGLEQVAKVLRAHGFSAVVLADSSRLTDRPPAVEAGLGRYGKNSMVITYSHGSWVLLGSILTTAYLPEGSPVEPECGPCRACIVRCPTGAIVDEGVIDARRCIAYLLQAPGPIPEEFREAVGDRLYGCDECQSCCPLNRGLPSKPLDEPGAKEATSRIGGAEYWVDPVWVLNAPNEELRRRFGHFYVPRRDFDYLRRNALVVLGNCGTLAELEAVKAFLDSPRLMLREHARWATERIQKRHSGAGCVPEADVGVCASGV